MMLQQFSLDDPMKFFTSVTGFHFKNAKFAIIMCQSLKFAIKKKVFINLVIT